jgi:hypothetical protein
MKICFVRDAWTYLLLACLLLAAMFAAWCYVVWFRSPMANYGRFLSHSSEYYAEVSRACSELIKNDRSETGAVQGISGNSEQLPPVLRGLYADAFEVQTNRVFISVGAGRAGYGIIWEQNTLDPSVWELKTDAEGLVHVVYSRKGGY